MKTFHTQVCAGLLLAATSSAALAQAPAGTAVPVTVDNYSRAESDVSLSAIVKQSAFGKFVHYRELARVETQTIVRPNRDTLYSVAVFDLDAGAVAVTLPDAGRRFMSMQVIDEDQYTPVVYYHGGSYRLDKEEFGTRYILVIVRTLLDPADPKDVTAVHTLQDAIKVGQKSPGTFDIPNWDEASLKKVRGALMTLGETIADTRRMFGAKVRSIRCGI
jgi:hypothetical protein